MKLYRLLKSDFLKLKGLFVFTLHLILPLLGAALFAAYIHVSGFDLTTKVGGSFQVIAMALPTLIAVVCSIVIDQEFDAGSGFHLFLSSRHKAVSLLSKVTLLLCLGFLSICLAGFSLGGLLTFLLKESAPFTSFYIIPCLIMFGSSIFLYIFHIFIGMCLGKGANIGIGITESLISALMVTGLGEGIWMFLPFAWGTRLTSMWIAISSSRLSLESIQPQLSLGITLCITITLLSITGLFIWFQLWEGRKTYD